MLDHLRRNLVAYLALFVALGGTSYGAAMTLAPNSVGTAQIKNGAVTGPKIASGVLHGLSASAFSDPQAQTPPSGGTRHVVRQVKITMPQAGKLLVLDAALEGAMINNTGNTDVSYSLGVYVDGVGVPGTYTANAIFMPRMTSQPVGRQTVGSGSLSNVTAGTHTVQLVLQTTSTSSDYVTSAGGSLFVASTG